MTSRFSLLCIVVLALTGVSAQSQSVFPGRIYPADMESWPPAFGDFNGDRVPDIFFASLSEERCRILYGAADGAFSAPHDVELGLGFGSVVSGDINCDGYDDLVRLADTGGDSLLVFLNGGDGTFTRMAAIPTADRFSLIGLADLNGDGCDDLVGLAPHLDTIEIRISNGDGTFAEADSLSYPLLRGYAYLLDADGDGHRDIVSPKDASRVALGKGDGTFHAFVNLTADLAVNSRRLDWNDDGVDDLAMLGQHRAGWWSPLLYGNGDGSYRSGTFMSLWQSADGSQVELCLGGTVFGLDEQGNTEVLASFRLPSLGASVRLRDVNSDGRADALILGYQPALAGVWLRQADGGFDVPMHFDGPFGYSIQTYRVLPADINNDGLIDVVMSGTYDYKVRFGFGDGRFGEEVETTLYLSPGALGDLNGDGYLDMVQGGGQVGGRAALLAYSGLGDGKFGDMHASIVDACLYSLTLVDVNADGSLDVVAPTQHSCDDVDPESYDNVVVALGNNDLTFQEPLRFAVGSHPVDVTVADLNGDGELDIASVNHRSNDVSVLLGLGGGAFLPEQRYVVGEPYPGSDYIIPPPPCAIASGDFNDDGIADLATANWSYSFSVLLGVGDGTFQSPAKFSNRARTGWLVVEDFDLDGHDDILCANYEYNSISLYLGLGDGTFRERQVFSVGAGPAMISVADMDGDGFPDALTANKEANTVSILLNKSASSSDDRGPCFIATAVYGTPLANEVDALRTFRDDRLMGTAIGLATVDAYYRLSPVLADEVATRPWLAGGVRLILAALLGWLRHPVLPVAIVILIVPVVRLRGRMS